MAEQTAYEKGYKDGAGSEQFRPSMFRYKSHQQISYIKGYRDGERTKQYKLTFKTSTASKLVSIRVNARNKNRADVKANDYIKINYPGYQLCSIEVNPGSNPVEIIYLLI